MRTHLFSEARNRRSRRVWIPGSLAVVLVAQLSASICLADPTDTAIMMNHGGHMYDTSLANASVLQDLGWTVPETTSGGIAFPLGGDFSTLYAVQTITLTGETYFGTIDLSTRAFTSIGASNPMGWGADIAMDPTSGVLYSINPWFAPNTTLHTIDVGTGIQSSAIGTMTNRFVECIAIDGSGQMYGIDRNTFPVSLLRIDKGTGAVSTSTFITFPDGMSPPPAPSPGEDHMALDFDLSDGKLYMTSKLDTGPAPLNRLFTLNPTTGVATSVGGWGDFHRAYMAIATAPAPVPATSTWGLVTLTLLILAAGTIATLRNRRVNAVD